MPEPIGSGMISSIQPSCKCLMLLSRRAGHCPGIYHQQTPRPDTALTHTHDPADTPCLGPSTSPFRVLGWVMQTRHGSLLPPAAGSTRTCHPLPPLQLPKGLLYACQAGGV